MIRFRSLLALVPLLLLPRAVLADELPSVLGQARAAYDRGSEAMGDKRWLEAALHFENAGRLNPHAASWYMAASAWEQAGQLDRAADAYHIALEYKGLPADRVSIAKTRLAGLQNTLGTVNVVAPSGWRVHLDDRPDVAAPAVLHGLPGTHVLLVAPADRAAFRRDLRLTPGQRSDINLTEADAPADSIPGPVLVPPPAPPPVPTERVVERLVIQEVPAQTPMTHFLGVGLMGAGVVGLGAGAVLGVSALSARDANQTSRTQEAFDHARRMQTYTNVAFVAGGLLAAGGVVLFILPKAGGRAAPTVSVGPSFVTFQGAL